MADPVDLAEPAAKAAGKIVERVAADRERLEYAELRGDTGVVASIVLGSHMRSLLVGVWSIAEPGADGLFGTGCFGDERSEQEPVHGDADQQHFEHGYSFLGLTIRTGRILRRTRRWRR